MSEPDFDPLEDAEAQTPAPSRDPGAAPEREGVPAVADDRTPGAGDVPEPGRPSMPTDAPVAATGYGTTEWEQQHPRGIDGRAGEEADVDDAAAEAENEQPARLPEEEALRVTEEPDSAAGEGP